MNIPFVDLKAQYKSIQEEIDNVIQEVLDTTAFIKGPFVKKFEEHFGNTMGVENVVSCANGTDAIYITLKALGIGPGDEVITVANSWISTSETISQTGAKPVFVDIHPDYYTIDISLIEKSITPSTKAIIPVHLYGQTVEMNYLLELCESRGLHLVEDCAQAHLAECNGRKAGTMGIAGTFSFFPGKNLGAYGDAGAVISNDDNFAKKARMFANHGSLSKHKHELEGINSRMDGMQAAVLTVKLRYLKEWTQNRRKVASWYDAGLNDISDVVIPTVRQSSAHVYHLYVIRTSERDSLKEFLHKEGVSTGIHYPVALPLLPAYDYLAYEKEDFPVASSYQSQILSLPIYPEMTEEKVVFVCDRIKSFFK